MAIPRSEPPQSSAPGVLLDTHIWLWLVNSSLDLLSEELRRTLSRAFIERRIFLSIFSLWEVALLESKKRIALEGSIGIWSERALGLPGLTVLPISSAVAIESNNLPGDFHPDPADRILVATARTMKLPLITVDRAILRYAEQGHVRVIH